LIQLFKLISLAYLRERPLKVLLTLLGMASGIAVFVAIQIANQSVLRSFENSITQLSGQADITVQGQGRQLTDEDYIHVKKLKGILEATPLIEDIATCLQNPDLKLSLLGFDPVSRAAFFPPQDLKLSPAEKKLAEQIFTMMSQPGLVLVPQNLLKNCPAKSTALFQVRYGQIILSFPYQTYEVGNSPWKEKPTLVMDIATAQELLGKIGQVSQIEIKLLPSIQVENWLQAQQKQLPLGLRLASQQERLQQGRSLLSAFQHNLLSLGLISIFVAVFIVYNSASISLLYRRSQIAVLRALGASHPRIWAIFLIEILSLGFLSACLGLLLGWFLAKLIFGQVLETVHQHYLADLAGSLSLSPTTILYGILLGGLASLLGAVFPLLEASRVSPIEATRKLSYERHIRKHPFLLLGLSAALAGMAAFSYLQVSFQEPNWAFLLAFAVLLGFLCLTPFLLRLLLVPLKTLFRRLQRPAALMASVQILENPYRYSMVTAALALAIALWIGIGMMVSSFRLSLEDWLRVSVAGDLYIDLEASTSNPKLFIPETLYQETRAWPEVEWVDTLKTVTVDYRGQSREISIVQLNTLMQQGHLNILTGKRESFAASSLEDSNHRTQTMRVAVSESFARKHGLELDNIFKVQSPWGDWTFQIKAILYDYSSEQGVIYVDTAEFANRIPQNGYYALALYLKDPSMAKAIKEKILKLPKLPPDLRISLQEQVYARVLSIFDQTFQVTQALRVVALFVAFLGILSTLALLMEEKRREVGLLQAIGMGPGHINSYGFLQGLLLAWVGYVMGAISGVALAWVIVKIVHYYFFGWSIHFYFNFPLLLQGLGLTLFTGGLASLWGIYLLKKLQPAEALRFDE
jgi:putative ABC transport system permease protein